MPELTPEQQQALARTTQYCDKLVAAIADLAANGGLAGLVGSLRPGSLAKAEAALRSARRAIDEQLVGPKAAPKPKVRPKPPAAPPVPPPEPGPSSPADDVPIRRRG